MGIAIRTSKLKNNRLRLSLDIYHKGQSKSETLELFLYEKPNTFQEREHNQRTKKIAESIRSKRILELQENRYHVFTGFKSQANFMEYFKKLALEKSRREGRHGTWYSAYKAFQKFIGNENLSFEECNSDVVKRFKEFLLTAKINREKTLAKNSAVTYFEKLKSALLKAIDDKIIFENPSKGISIQKEESNRVYLQIEEIRDLFNTECECDILKRAFLFSCLTGLRWSDVYKLTWKEVVYAEQEQIYKLLYTQKKTQKVQYHPIQDQAFRLLGDRGNPDSRVFKGVEYGVHTNSKLKLWTINAGINKHVTFHVGRHTYATLMLTQGADIFTVSKLLGHADVTTTQIYAKVIDKKRNEAVNLLPSISI